MQLRVAMILKNKLIIAAAGSGKTTHIVEDALQQDNKVLITTFTEANRDEIERKILKYKKYIPKNITIQTWFSVLLQHGVRPYQDKMNDALYDKKVGFYLCEGKSGLKAKNKSGIPIYWGEKDFFHFYFTKDLKIYSDKISKFVYNCNKKTNNEVVNRLTRIYQNIYIDEIQDLAGWDLDLIKLLLKSSSQVVMVGDPRQATYTTNDSSRFKKYRGRIDNFIINECSKNICDIDLKTLNKSHRNCENICKFSSKLYPEYQECVSCGCDTCKKDNQGHEGIFLVSPDDVSDYCSKYENIKKLRYSKAKNTEINFGASKGLGFDRIIIFPTQNILKYLKSGNISDIESIKAKFYVALTRARHSVAIVCNYKKEDQYIEGINKYLE